MDNSVSGSDSVLPSKIDIPGRLVGNELLLRDSKTGIVHFLTATAALVWTCCDGQMTVGACAAKMQKEFEVPEGVDLTSDIVECVQGLQEKGLLQDNIK